jgi:hypothetical protein
MSPDKYPIQQKLAELKKILDGDPTNLDAANRYWEELASLGEEDVRSGGFVLEAYRKCALASAEGVVAFARGYRELFEKTGEKPSAKLLDEELLQTLKAACSELSGEDQEIVRWILTCVKE